MANGEVMVWILRGWFVLALAINVWLFCEVTK